MARTSSAREDEPLKTGPASGALFSVTAALDRAAAYPRLRFMGSKYRLIPWMADVLQSFEFDSVLDAFSGSGVVGYFFKALGKRVISNDFLNFSAEIARALIENSTELLSQSDIEMLLEPCDGGQDFVRRTFSGIFYTSEELQFLDDISQNIRRIADQRRRSLAISALTRACMKKQPRGVFTVSDSGERYDDGRRDLRLTLREHFLEQVALYNASVFSNGRRNLSSRFDVFALPANLYEDAELVYLDPPYVPRSDDNDYIKRYHFVEGLSTYWSEDRVIQQSKVKKLPKRYTPFAYRRTALSAFDDMFAKFRRSIIALSYSSNGYPDLDELMTILRRHKKNVQVHGRDHRYHFGTHKAVQRALVEEYLIIGS